MKVEMLDFTTNSGINQMNKDRILMKKAKEENRAFFRIYNFSSKVITLGFLQKEEEVVYKEICNRDKIEVVSRPTGGGSVFHYNDITYSVVLPLEHPLAQAGVLKSYERIAKIFKKAFEKTGLKIREYKGKAIRSPFCFSAPAPFELLIDHKKFMGSAQLRRDGILLQQGVIMFGEPSGIENYIKNVDRTKFTFLLKWIDIDYKDMVNIIYKTWKENYEV